MDMINQWDFSTTGQQTQFRGSPHCRGFTITLIHTTLGRTPLDVISPRQRPLPDNTLKRDKHPCPCRDMNPQFQRAKGRLRRCGHWDRSTSRTRLKIQRRNLTNPIATYWSPQ